MKRLFFLLLLVGCAGMKVINPNDQNPNEGTLALDINNGKLSLEPTYTCKIESLGKRYSAFGKAEAAARKEILYKCQSGTLISDCKPEKISCVKN